MMAQARRERIAAELAQHRFLSVQEIADRFHCSLATIRRDLQALAGSGRIHRSRGGALSTYVEAPMPRLLDPDEQPIPFLEEKRRIARAAAALVGKGDTVGLSGGTTTYEVARCLRGRTIGVVTNAVDLALEIAAEPGPQVVVVGGVLDFSHGHELLGPVADLMLAQLHIDTLFVSVDGLSATIGATIIGELNAHVMRVMAARARRVVVVADHTKIGRTALSKLLPISAISICVTDAYGPSPELEAIRAAGVQVIEV